MLGSASRIMGAVETDPLESFVRRTQKGKRALVQEQWADAIAAALFDGTGCVPAHTSGRGEVFRFPCGPRWGILRRYLRGGAIRHVLNDAYVLANRPLRELKVHARLYQMGLSVPEPLGACWERRGLLVRGALATAEVDADTLLDYLRSGPADADVILRRCGALIREMHDLDVFHADLQVRNILVGADKVYLLDFDNARFAGSLSPLERARNLFRLRRSIEKTGLPLEHFQTICEGYGAEALPAWAGRIYKAKGRLSDALSGRKKTP